MSASSKADKKCTGYARAGKATAMEIGLYSEAQEMLQCPRLDIRRRELCEKTMIEKIAFGDCLSCHLTLTRENEHRHNVRNFEQFSSFKCRTDRFGYSFSPSMINVLNK